MSTENKNLVESIQRDLEAIRSKSEDSVSKAEMNNLVSQVEALQNAMAAANTVSAADVEASADEQVKSEVGGFFAKTDADTSALTIAAQGGYLLPKIFNDMVDGNIRKASPLRGLAKVVQGGLGFVTPMKVSNGTAGLRGEFDALHYSAAPKYNLLNHTFQEINSTEAVTVWADLNPTNRIDYTQSVIQDVTEAMAEQESDYFMRGATQHALSAGGTIRNGLLSQTKLVAGVTEYTNTVGSMAGVETAAVDAVDIKDIVSALFTLHTKHDANTSILTSREVLKSLFTAVDENGRYILTVGNIQDGFAARVLGKGVTTGDFFPAIADAGNVPVAIMGDFRKAVVIADASPVSWLVDPYTDKRLLQYTGRRLTSSAVVDFNALRALYVKQA